MDSQPWPALASVVFISLNVVKSFDRKVLLIFFIVPAFLVASLYTMSGVDFYFIRAGAAYIGFALIYFSFYLYLKRYGFPMSVFVAINAIYILAGLLQYIFGVEVLSVIINVRSSADRGVTSLTPEPTYFGIFLFFLSWIYLVQCNYHPKKWLIWLIFINLLAIVFLAKSSMVFVFILGFIAFYCLKFFRARHILYVVVILSSLILPVIMLMEGTRIYSLFMLFYEQGVSGVVYADASVNSRLADVILPLHGFIKNWFMPGGFSSYAEASLSLRDDYNGFFWYGGGENVIMSYLGSFIYELGIFGLVYMLMIFKLATDGTRHRLIDLLLLWVLLNFAIPVGFSLIPIMLALMFFYRDCNGQKVRCNKI
ncbi:MAG: hypothetical protein ACRC07_15985 [Pseudomonas paracarnis]